MDDPVISRRHVVFGAMAAAAFADGSAAAPPAPGSGGTFRPEQFGAVGDGQTDDTPAFQQLGAAVSAAGGGTVVLRPRATYRIGRQVATHGSAPRPAQPAFLQQTMLRIEGVSGLRIQGNGASLKLNGGLRYGSFDPATGEPFVPPAGNFTRPSFGASVGNMVDIVRSTDVHIVDLILDGNMDDLLLGGRWGDRGIQLSATGLQLDRVSGALIERLVSRNHGLDGVYLRGRNVSQEGGAADNIVLRDVRCDRNGRQGMSVVGGKGLRFEGCTFSNTGQGRVSSSPTAGVDLEPNGSNWTTDATFDQCEFANNRDVGLLADTGNSRGLTVLHCTFWQGFAPRPGVTRNSGDALWLGREGVRIEDCAVHGTVTHMPPSAQILRTSFDNAVHPAFGRSAQIRPYLLDDASGTYTDCTFSLDGDGRQGLISAGSRLALRRCRLRFAGTGLSTGKAVAYLSSATTLEDVTFGEGPAVNRRHYIAGNGARLVGKVVVTGPQVRWGTPNGRVGNIAAPGG